MLLTTAALRCPECPSSAMKNVPDRRGLIKEEVAANVQILGGELLAGRETGKLKGEASLLVSRGSPAD